MARSKKASSQPLEKKWTAEALEPGFTAVPSVVLWDMNALGLTTTDFTVLCYLVSRWWDVDRLPYPTYQRMATELGINPRTVKRSIQRMEAELGLLEVKRRRRRGGTNQSNEYSFGPLIKKLRAFALKRTKEAKERAEQERKRLGRKLSRVELEELLADAKGDE